MKSVPEKSDNDEGPTETTALKPKLETLDDALPFVGDFGKYQYYLLLGLLPYTFGYATLYFSQFFLTLTPTEHWCKVDELIHRNFSEAERYDSKQLSKFKSIFVGFLKPQNMNNLNPAFTIFLN